MKRFQALLIGLMIIFTCICAPAEVYADNEEKTENTQNRPEEAVDVSAPSVILMEASTGTVIFEKDSDTARPPASVTKIMTMLLIFDALEAKQIHLDDQVTVSEYAASMGGSQVFLEAGEVQTVDTMLKCIAVASANDACVAMAEYISGNEEEFVKRMNDRAAELGMKNTHFVNCNGLDTEEHVMSARDIALMSRELINKYPQVHDYSMIWMENITHTTKKGTSEFGLTNTNKLVRQYEYATGLKTGSTGNAKFCVSATAEKNGVELIAVVMAAENSKDRFADAVKMLNYGFGKCQLYTDESSDGIKPVSVENGVKKKVKVQRSEPFSYLDTNGANINGIKRTVEMNEEIRAPLKEGDTVGNIIYTLDDSEIGRTTVIAAENIKEASFFDYLQDAAGQWMI